MWQIFVIPGFESMQLLQNVTSTINKVCQKLKKDDYTTPEERKGAVAQGRVIPTAVAAVKNGRRKMEDRHVVLHDVNAVYSSQIPKVGSETLITTFTSSSSDEIKRSELVCLPRNVQFVIDEADMQLQNDFSRF